MYYKSMKEDENSFLIARKGDWFISPYQCEKYWFINVCGQLPRRTSVGYKHTLELLRRDNIDILWSRDTATVKDILGYTNEIEMRAREGGILVSLPEINPWPVGTGWAWLWLFK